MYIFKTRLEAIFAITARLLHSIPNHGPEFGFGGSDSAANLPCAALIEDLVFRLDSFAEKKSRLNSDPYTSWPALTQYEWSHWKPWLDLDSKGSTRWLYEQYPAPSPDYMKSAGKTAVAIEVAAVAMQFLNFANNSLRSHFNNGDVRFSRAAPDFWLPVAPGYREPLNRLEEHLRSTMYNSVAIHEFDSISECVQWHRLARHSAVRLSFDWFVRTYGRHFPSEWFEGVRYTFGNVASHDCLIGIEALTGHDDMSLMLGEIVYYRQSSDEKPAMGFVRSFPRADMDSEVCVYFYGGSKNIGRLPAHVLETDRLHSLDKAEAATQQKVSGV